MNIDKDINLDILIDKIVNWCKDNRIREDNSFDYDGYNINKDGIGVVFTNYNGDRYNFYVNISSYGGGIGMFKLNCYEDENIEGYNRWNRDISSEILFDSVVSEKGLSKLKHWIDKNTNFTLFPTFAEAFDKKSELNKIFKDFIYKVNDSNTLKIQSNYELIDAFFDDNSDEAYNNNETITILAIDTKQPIIKLTKQYQNDSKVYKFIVEITTENDDDFIVRMIIDSKDKFKSILESTINSLREFKEFYKYADDLEACL